MLKPTKHKKHHSKAKLSSKLQKAPKIMKPAATETLLSNSNSNLTPSLPQVPQNISTVPSELQIQNNPQESILPYFEETVLNEYKSKQYSKCIKTIERILKVTPKEEASHYKILLAAANTMIGKRFKRSHNLLNEVLALNPYDSYALYGKGVAFYFEGKFEDSLKYFDLAIEVDEKGMEKAKEMKIRAQLENKQVRVMLEKIKIEVGEKSDDDDDESFGKIGSFGGEIENLDENIAKNCSKSGQNSGKTQELRENSQEILNIFENFDKVETGKSYQKLKNHEHNGENEKVGDKKTQNYANLSKNCDDSAQKLQTPMKMKTEIVLGDHQSLDEENIENYSKNSENLQSNAANYTNSEDREQKIEQNGVNPGKTSKIAQIPTKSTPKNSKSSLNSTLEEESSNFDDKSLKTLRSGNKKSSRKSKTATTSIVDAQSSTKATRRSTRISSNSSQNFEDSSSISSKNLQLSPENSQNFPKNPSSKQETQNLLHSTPQTNQASLAKIFSSESLKQISSKSTLVVESSSEDDSSDLRPTSSANSFAQIKFNKALDLYMLGELQRSLKYFQKSLKFEPDFEEADEMGTKAQEFIDLLDVVEINMSEKNYEAVVEICTEGLDIDEGNDAVNRKILFQRGLAYFHLGENEKSLKDYGEYERLGMKLEMIEEGK